MKRSYKTLTTGLPFHIWQPAIDMLLTSPASLCVYIHCQSVCQLFINRTRLDDALHTQTKHKPVY